MPYCLYFNSTAKLQLLFEITKIFGDYFHGKVESPHSPVEELTARVKTSLDITWMKQGGEEEEHTSEQLCAKYGNGWSYSNLRQMRQFYMVYGNLTDTVCQIQNSKPDFPRHHCLLLVEKSGSYFFAAGLPKTVSL